MSPFFLIDVADLRDRAGVTRHSHVRLNPSRLLSALRKLFGARGAAGNCR